MILTNLLFYSASKDEENAIIHSMYYLKKYFLNNKKTITEMIY